LKDVIENNGFAVNDRKVRLLPSARRQEITGLTTNRFPNVHRKFVRQIRAMLHAWDKYGLDAAGQKFFSEFDYRRRTGAPPTLFAKVVKGKLDFLKLVRGHDDRTYLALLKRYASLDPSFRKASDLPEYETDLNKLRSAVFVIESDETQGTAFLLDGVGLVTCAHVVGANMIVSRPGDSRQYKVRLEVKDVDRDLAILNFVDAVPLSSKFARSAVSVDVLDQVTLLGFPGYREGATGIVYQGAVIGKFNRFGQPRIQVSCEIVQGNSGGPVLDKNYRVIGVAANGKERLGKRGDELYGVIPVAVLDSLERGHGTAVG